MKTGLDEKQAWEKASCEIFTKGSYAQKKPCPKNAFYGIVSENSQGKNANYAKDALNILKANKGKVYSPDELWKLIMNAPPTHNHQMDVVLALWNEKLI